MEKEYYKKMRDSLIEKLEYIKLYVPRIDSWAISDTFIPTLKPPENKSTNVLIGGCRVYQKNP